MTRSRTSWLTRWWRSVRQPARPKTHRHNHPQLERLEDRCLLTAYTVTTTLDKLNDITLGQVTLRDVLTAISTQKASGNAAAGTAFNTVDFNINKAYRRSTWGAGGTAPSPPSPARCSSRAPRPLDTRHRP